MAVSEDSGQTWKHFKTIEVSEGLDQNPTRVQPDQAVRMVRANKDCGEIPCGWSFFHYPNADFAGDKVFIMYLRGGLVEQGSREVREVGQLQEQVLKVFPVSWLYEE